MIVTFQELSSQWRYTVDKIQRIQQDDNPNNNSIWMDRDYIWGTMLPAVLGTAVICSILFWIVTPTVVRTLLPDDAPTPKVTKARYQLTNLCFNFYIGSLGYYYFYYVLPTLPSYHYESDMDRIPGHANLYIFSALQLGYQLWALPVGLYCVKESTEMIVHHLAVVLASSMSGFTVCGFRYVSVYFFGLMELSSIPLAIMNAFKDHPEWRERHPFFFLLTRAIFSFSFLYIRIYMWCFIGPQFLWHDFVIAYTAPPWSVVQAFLSLQFAMASFLGVLQFYWAYLVTKGIASWLLFNLPVLLKQLLLGGGGRGSSKKATVATENGHNKSKTS